MKRIILFVVAFVMITSFACADFYDDFNEYSSMYGIENLEKVSSFGYKLPTVEIIATDEITLYSSEENIPDLLAASCCAMRCIDNQGNMLDQYGRLLHAYFMAKAGGEKRATTETGMLIFFTITPGLVTVRLVK